MALISTVTGFVESTSLGRTLVHEHLRVRREAVYSQFPHLYDVDAAFGIAVHALGAVRKKGIQTICDPTVMGLGRDIHFMRAVAEATGVHIIPATGAFTTSDLPPYFAQRSIDHLADALVHDIEVGIQETNIRAAFLKCATDLPGVTPDVEKSLRAVARAHRRTGVPIMTHSLAQTESGVTQQDIFEHEGVDLRFVMIGHSGDSGDLAYLERLAERGSYLGMDRYGMEDVRGTRERNQTLLDLCRLGYMGKLMLSHDSVINHDRVDPPSLTEARTNWHISFLVDEVFDQLIAMGMSQDTLDSMTIQNPMNWLERTSPY